jgi:hypothetical protein
MVMVGGGVQKIGSVILSYGNTRFLETVIKQYIRFDNLLVMNFLFPESEPYHDNTRSICQKLGVRAISGLGIPQHLVLNRGMDELKHCDMLFIADSDEIILNKEQDELIKRQTESPNTHICSNMYEYAGDLYHIYEPRGHRPIVMVKPEERFCEVRNGSGGGIQMNDIYMHHLGFLSKDVEWKRKKQIKTNGYDSVTELMKRPIQQFTPPQELVDMLK